LFDYTLIGQGCTKAYVRQAGADILMKVTLSIGERPSLEPEER
jgi:hypothetical protein